MVLKWVGVGVACSLAVFGGSFAASANADPWADLHRPLNLPRVGPTERCPVSKVDERVDWPSLNIFGSSGVGRGPVYPGLGASGGHIAAQPESRRGSWYAEKVFWYVSPDYTDRVLIRGRRIDKTEKLRFNDNGRRSRELRIRRSNGISWNGQPEGARGEPSGVVFRRSGCFGVQIDGYGFSRKVIFSTSVPR